MKAKKIALTRGLPKTGQSVEYTAGDDGTYQAGWWLGRTVANNKDRFIAKTIAGDDVVSDRATGLIWGADGDGAGCVNGASDDFAAQIAYANTLTFAGFTNWRVPNIFELLSIMDFSLSNPCIVEPPFSNTYSSGYWSSTTDPTVAAKAFYVSFSIPFIATNTKAITNFRARLVRSI